MTTLDAALAPLDAARARLYRLGGRWASRWLAERDTRVAVFLAFGVVTTLLGTLFFPFTLLLYAPLVLGVPHLLADVRYLVVRPGLHRRFVAVPLVLALGATFVTMAPWVGLLAVLGVTVFARTEVSTRLLGLAAWAVLTAWAVASPGTFTLALMHGHNAVALGVWWVWRGERGVAQRLGLGLAVAAYAALALGALDAVAAGPGLGGVPIASLAHEVAPFAEPCGSRLVLAYVFGQGLHYVAWLRLIPEDDRARRTPRPFRATARALVADLGGPALVLFVVATVLFLTWGGWDAVAARHGYLRAALFHGHLELAALVLAALEGRRPGQGP